MWRSSWTRDRTQSPASAGGFLSTEPPKVLVSHLVIEGRHVCPVCRCRNRALEVHVPQLIGGRGGLACWVLVTCFCLCVASNTRLPLPRSITCSPQKHPEAAKAQGWYLVCLWSKPSLTRATSCSQAPSGSSQGRECVPGPSLLTGRKNHWKNSCCWWRGAECHLQTRGQVTNESTPPLGLGKWIYYLQSQSVGLDFPWNNIYFHLMDEA